MKKLFTESKLRIVVAFAMTIILIILAILAYKGEGMNLRLFIPLILMAVGAGIITALRFRFSKRLGIVILGMIPPAALCLMEFYTHVPWDLTILIFILNLIFYYLLYALFSVVLGSTKRGFIGATLVPMLFGLTNFFVVSFRGTPIVPWDLYSIGTAMSITDNYTFSFSYTTVFVLFGFIYLMIFAEKTEISIKKWKVRFIAIAAAIVCMAGYVTMVKTDAVEEIFGLDDILFTPNVLYRNNGFMVAFLANFRYINIEKPEGYTPEAVEETKIEIESENKNGDTKKDLNDLPNIVVIMNEAFSDLAVWGDFDTNEDYMPFIHSLKDNTIKGNMFVSVKGGNTANTEFEFLTGNTMAFLPVGSVAYQQFVKTPMPSLASYLKNMGYTTNAIHPYYASGWNRDQVYPDLGFDKFYTIDDFEYPEIIRDYVSDKSSFEKIIELYEYKGENEKMFTFEVTMQNHGGYSKETPGFDPTIELTQFSEEEKSLSVISAEKYLTLVKKTDEAFEELVNYFKSADEDTIIVMFGDHQPSDYITDTISKRLNNLDPESSIETMQKGYIVPMVMWANYEIEEEEIDQLSVNYLSGILMENAGIPLTDYQLYLQKQRETLPVVTANVHIDKDGKYYENSSKVYQDILNQYSILQYNYLRDTKNRVDDFFGGTLNLTDST